MLKGIVSYSIVTVCCLMPFKIFAGDDVKIDAVISKETYTAGDTVLIALKVNIPENYHLYGNPMGPGIGRPVSISVDDTKFVKWMDVLKPKPEKFVPRTGDWVWAYKKSTFFIVRGIIGTDAKNNVNGTITFHGLICNTACIPIDKNVSFSLNISDKRSDGRIFKNAPDLAAVTDKATDKMPISLNEAQKSLTSSGLDFSNIKQTTVPHLSSETPNWDYSPHEAKTNFNIWLAIFFGFIAGIILNVMPCVLPVLGIKLISFSQSGDGSPKNALKHGSAFSTGMLSVFMMLAAFASFAGFSWGEQFQNPKALAAIIAVIFVFALSLFDVFTITIPGAVSNFRQKTGTSLTGDFLNGMLATLLATPCSGPFLGATLAWTLTQSPQVIFAVFTSIGLGMSFPYILFSSSKRLSRLIPRPGKWMKDFKSLMGFLLMGAAMYLMTGLPQNMMIGTLGLCLFITFGIMVYGRFSPFGAPIHRRVSMSMVLLVIVFSGIYVNFGLFGKSAFYSEGRIEKENEQWKDFSPELLKAAHAESRNVIIDFTANWCMNCQYNKVAVLNSKDIEKLIEEKNVLALKADLTRPAPQIEALLHNLGSRSVPFLAVFPRDNPYEPIVMRDLLDRKSLKKVLENLR